MKIHNLNIINDDCMNVMKEYKDNYFDLAIVDTLKQKIFIKK